MNRDYEQSRVTQQIEALKREQQQLTQDVFRAQNDEQFELKRLKREFETKISTMKNRQTAILREVEQKEKELERLVARQNQETSPQTSASISDKEQQLHRYR